MRDSTGPRHSVIEGLAAGWRGVKAWSTDSPYMPRLVAAGMATLYWELLLIRWLSAWVRIVAYYTNFVLIAAFFGLGLGALLARHRFRLTRWLAPLLSLGILAALAFSQSFHLNPASPQEHIWIGAPSGMGLAGATYTHRIPLPLLLGFLYVLVAAIFACFGQWLGLLFEGRPPLRAYCLQIVGNILGILLFASFSFLGLSPAVWILVGFITVLGALDMKRSDRLIASVLFAGVLAAVVPAVRPYVWSPYYKIRMTPITSIEDTERKQIVQFPSTVGYSLTVNNDYHQMLLDLRPSPQEHPFFTSWRQLYEFPYALDKSLPEGPILVIGAGTGNDVMAALRATNRRIYAVDIDPAIVGIGRTYHPERPYQDPRVTLIVDDARSFMQKTPVRFAIVVFGFLDSHTLFSSFSSLRLDNFVYTTESFRRVKEILVPGGEVAVTFACPQEWLFNRMSTMMDQVFDAPTDPHWPPPPAFANGIVFRNFKAPVPAGLRPLRPSVAEARLPTDDWPFFYLQSPRIPSHYIPFLLIIVGLGSLSLLGLPGSQRRLNLPYYFMGAAFFLLETSNVVNLSLLFGSTWAVNVVVFLGILCLTLVGTLSASGRIGRLPAWSLFLALFASLAVSYWLPASALLGIESMALRVAAASVIFLGPVFFAAVIFAQLIRGEEHLAQAYGSNLLGAVVGGACEYLSLAFGFHFLLRLAFLLYFLAFLTARNRGRTNAAPAITATPR